MMRSLLVVCAFAFALPLARTAHAQGAAGARPPPERSSYRYVFDDDLLAAGAFDPSDTRIRVVPGAARRTLIQPRTTFVPELLMSVEKL